jgi:hypothetical protein
MACSQSRSYTSTPVSFAANLLWIAIGSALLAIARSYARSGNWITAEAVGVIGGVALAAGLFL